MSDLLNSYQKNSLTVVLRILEERLRRIERWLQGYEESGILYQYRLNLSSEQRGDIHRQVTQALEHIAELKQRFDLRVIHEDARAMFRSEMSSIWANLCDTRADKLKRYGAVSPRLASMLDPSIDALVDLSLSIALSLKNDENE